MLESFLFTYIYFVDQIAKLTVLGFDKKDCVEALRLCENKLDDAALWLTQNANPVFSYGSNTGSTSSSDKIHIKVIEVNSRRDI